MTAPRIIVRLEDGQFQSLSCDAPIEAIIIDSGKTTAIQADEYEVVFDGEDIIAGPQPDVVFEPVTVEQLFDQIPQPFVRKASVNLNSYTVTWRIDVDAQSPEDAARVAETLMPNGSPFSLARAYTVVAPDGTEACVNLGETYEDFEHQFGPAQRQPSGDLFDFSDIQALASEHVWTIVEGDSGGLYVCAGKHVVNRLGYVTTAKPSKTGNEQYLWG